MKKIIAVLLSFQLVWLSTQPAWADRFPGRKGITAAFTKKGLPAGAAVNPGRLARGASLGQLDKTLLHNMRLPLSTLGARQLPQAAPLVIPPQIEGSDLQKILRTSFVAQALQNKVNPVDRERAVDFYRNNLQHAAKHSLPETIADIASLGLLGTPQDAAAILKVAQQVIGTPWEAALVAAAARAMLRLEAYGPLITLAKSSTVQPELWDGIREYIHIHRLPVELPQTTAYTEVDISSIQADLMPFGPINSLVVHPCFENTILYMNTGRDMKAPARKAFVPAQQRQINKAPSVPLAPQEIVPAPHTDNTSATDEVVLPKTPAAQTAGLVTQSPATLPADPQMQIQGQALQWLLRLLPKSIANIESLQRWALYAVSLPIGFELGTPIMANIQKALNLSLSYTILVTAATFSPYLFGSFLANWLKRYLGRKGTINAGLGLMAGSLILGSTLLGLDGSFTAWENPDAQYLCLLALLTTLGTGAAFIHNSILPLMSEISQTVSELMRNQRGANVEIARASGMWLSYLFPVLATGLLGLDWSATFVLALPFVMTAGLALNTIPLPNTRVRDNATEKVRTASGKLRSSTSYLYLLRESPGIGSFLGSLFNLNAIEVALNSFCILQLAQLLPENEFMQHLLAMIQYSVAFTGGRILAKYFLKWIPKRNLSVASLLTAAAALAALPVVNDPYLLTASLFTAELGISTAFTNAYANKSDKVTTLIMASAVSCVIVPFILTQVANLFVQLGLLSVANSTTASLLAIPAALTLLSVKLFRRSEAKTFPDLSNDLHLKKRMESLSLQVANILHNRWPNRQNSRANPDN